MSYENAEQMLAAALAGETLDFEACQRLERRIQDDRLHAALLRFRDGNQDWDNLSEMMGNHERPALLSVIWWRLPHAQLLHALRDAWVHCDAPEKAMRRRDWLPIFERAGYHDSDQPGTAPDSIALWRGGIRRTGMSWTADRERAEWFQRRWESLGPAHLWTATVRAERLLAHYGHRDEDEYVVNTTGLRPRLVA
jgi:hypothetical protein